MLLIENKKPRVMEIADRIQADIKSRRLSAGDAYLTTAEVARLLHIGTASANKALQLLVQQGVLKRRNKSGCIIAGAAESPRELARVQILVHRDYMRIEGLFADDLILGLRNELPGVQIFFNFLPQYGEPEFVQKVIAETLRLPDKSGFILARSSFALQSLMASTGMPAVVLGTPYRAVQGLASLDRDHDLAGSLLAKGLLNRGCKELIVLMRATEWPGDFPFMDAILHEFSSSGISANHIKIRHLPPEENAIIAEMAYLLAGCSGLTGVIARSEPLTLGALKAIEQLRRKQKVFVVASDMYRQNFIDSRQYIGVTTQWSAEQIGAQLGRMLREQALGHKLKTLHEVIPVCEKML